MKRLFLLAAAALGSSIFFVPPASAVPVDPDGPVPYWSSVVPASDPPPRVTAKVVPAPLPKVTVVAGDTLTAIGARTHRTWEALASFNHIPNPNLIYVGDVLRIPPLSYTPPPIALPAPAPSPPPARYSVPVRTSYTPPAPPPVVSHAGGSGGGGFTGIWACIAQHESGGNAATNTGNGYEGLYQFAPSTWASLNTGYAHAYDAPASVQTAAAQRLQAEAGWGQWPTTSAMCGV
jgi:LysM repeat protein